MKKSKRFLSLLLALLMSLGVFTSLGTTAFAASSEMTLYMVDLPRGADNNKSGWGHPKLSFMGGWSQAARDNYFSVFCQDSYDGRVVYCIEPGIPCKTGDSYSGFSESFWDNYPSGLNPTISPTVIKAYLGRIMQYGYQGTASTSWNSANSSDADKMAHLIATQLLVWETVVGERDSQFSHVWGSSQGKNNIIQIIADNHPLRSRIFSYYNQIEKSVQQHTMLPSFFTRSSAATGTYELAWNGTNYSATLTDTNGVLGNYRFSSSTAGLKFSVSGNKLTISCDTAPKGAISITAKKTNGQRMGVVVWLDGKIAGATQDFTTYGATVSDPVKGYLNLEVKTGNMKLVKTSEDGKVDGISFSIVGEGINTTKTTNKNGVIDITDLNPGVYTVTEQFIDKYEPQAVQRVTIVSGQTATVNFNNTLKRGELSVTKTSEDGLVEGVKFHLSGISLSGLPVDEYAITNANGVANFKNVLISGTEPYTLEEVDTAIRYVLPEAQTAAIAIYGLYKGDTLIDSYKRSVHYPLLYL